jgi:hypothetical protein
MRDNTLTVDRTLHFKKRAAKRRREFAQLARQLEAEQYERLEGESDRDFVRRKATEFLLCDALRKRGLV